MLSRPSFLVGFGIFAVGMCSPAFSAATLIDCTALGMYCMSLSSGSMDTKFLVIGLT